MTGHHLAFSYVDDFVVLASSIVRTGNLGLSLCFLDLFAHGLFHIEVSCFTMR